MAQSGMKALVANGKGIENLELVANYPVPSIHPGEVLVKIVASAINPVDWKMAKTGFFIKSFPVVLGADIAGEIVAVGADVTNFKNGDHVYAFTNLGAPGCGGFSEYSTVSEFFLGRKPATITFEEASTLPVGALTAFEGIFQKCNIPLISIANSTSRDQFFLVWGASSSVGVYAVQLAKLAGFTVVATASPRNFEYVRSLGASHVLDYTKDNVVQEIITITGGKLQYALDCISAETTVKCISCISPSGGHVSFINDSPKIAPANVALHSVFLGAAYGVPEDRIFVHEALPILTDLLTRGLLKPNEVQLLPNGLQSVPEGFELSATNKVSAKKLVVRIDQTPN